MKTHHSNMKTVSFLRLSPPHTHTYNLTLHPYTLFLHLTSEHLHFQAAPPTLDPFMEFCSKVGEKLEPCILGGVGLIAPLACLSRELRTWPNLENAQTCSQWRWDHTGLDFSLIQDGGSASDGRLLPDYTIQEKSVSWGKRMGLAIPQSRWVELHCWLQ